MAHYSSSAQQFHLLHPNLSMKFIFAVLLAAVTSVVGDSYREPHRPMTDTSAIDGTVP
jgi:hypothetical protein